MDLAGGIWLVVGFDLVGVGGICGWGDLVIYFGCVRVELLVRYDEMLEI